MRIFWIVFEIVALVFSTIQVFQGNVPSATHSLVWAVFANILAERESK